ncbi:MAG: ferredoxin--NADP reductase, partial [Steroidobacteraceae bacterium]
MAAIGTERVLTVRHWTDTQFTFTTTRDRGLRFANGQFVMLGLALGGRALLR